MGSATTRRLPGIRFESRPPVATTILPRMDVAGFVGFASSGPLHVPVAIEDAAQFADVFGPDAPLAWDPEHAEGASAQLGATVRAFFRNGGTRCWVVRVADAASAETAAFPLPGFAAISGSGTISPAMLAARSPGSGADGLLVSASIAPQLVPVTLAPAGDGPPSFTAPVSSPADLELGDLIRFSFPDSDWTLFLTVADLQGTSGISCWVRVATLEPGSSGELSYCGATISASAGGPQSLSIPGTPGAAPPPGSVVGARLGDQSLWLEIAEVQGSADGRTTLLVTPFELSSLTPDPAPAGAAAYAERVTLELTVGDGQGQKWVLGGFALGAGHAGFAGALPSDAELYAADAPALAPGPLTLAASAPRFPLAGPADPPAAFLPLGAWLLPGPSLGAIVSPTAARTRDGLAQFGAALFLDPDLARTDPAILLEQANWTRYGSPSPRPLIGMHSLLAIDEATIVAAPDAIQRSWSAVPSSTPLPAPPAADPPAPSASPPNAPPPFGFQDCDRLIPAAPELPPEDGPGAPTQPVPTGALDRFVLDPPAAYSPVELELVQLGLLRMCAARGDMLAVLSLPEQYGDGEAISHLQALRTTGSAAGGLPDPVFGFGAAYHPWLYCADAADPTLILRIPPEGAAAGVIASRSLDRGAWTAPANVALRDVVALDPPIGPGAYAALQAAQLNLVRREPRGFLWLAADTLTEDDELRPIGVRRLLQLLRRVALLHGASYAFEGNSEIVRRTVQRGFERILARMFALGAFAGATAAQAFVVNVLAPVDAGADGQLVIELQVAPSRPLSFITVRLVRSGGGGLQVEIS